MDAAYKRFLSVGPGGLRCPCCGPAPGVSKVKALRAAKRRERAFVRRAIEKEAA